MMVERFLGKQAAEYLVVGLMTLKPEVDTFSGTVSYNIDCKLGDSHNPINFLPFFERVQRDRQAESA